MILGSKTLAEGDKRRYKMDYNDFLSKGYHIVTATVTVPAGTNSTVGAISYEENRKAFWFFLNAGSINENFTATIQVTDNEGQVVTDTINFVITNP